MSSTTLEVISIRPATTSDVQALSTLCSMLGYPADPETVARRMERFLAHPATSIHVAEIDDSIVGFITFIYEPLFHQDGNCGTITALSVHNDHQGKGIGKLLVKEIEKVAKEAGCIKIAVASGVQRLEAHEFYRRLGYMEITKRFVKQLT